MRTSEFLLILLTLAVACKDGAGSAKDDSAKDASIEVAAARFRDLRGNPVNLSSFEGKRILVNYWATWCVPCRVEFPSLVSAQEKLKNENYVFLFPSPDETKMILEFQQKQKYPFRYLKLEGSLASVNVHALPSTVIYSSDGKEYKRLLGAHEWDKENIINMLKQVP